MNHQCSPTSCKDGAGIIAERHVRRGQRRPGFALGVDPKIWDVAGVRPVRIFETVLFPVGIKVCARRFEVRGVTFCGLVNMNGVLSRSQIVHVQFDLYPLRCSRKNSGANAFALSVLQLHSHRFWTFVALGVSRGQRKREHCGYKQQFSWKYSFESHVLTSFVTVILPDLITGGFY